MNDLYLRLEVV